MKTKKEKEKEKPKPNKLEKLVLKITKPMKMDQELTLQQISVFVGENDSGKSFLLKVAFALGAVGSAMLKPVDPKIKPPDPNLAAQFIFDNTFVDQKFDGLFKSEYTNGSVSVEIKDGKITNVEANGQTIPVKFMSTDMRTFDQMVTYLRMRKYAGEDPIIFMNRMLETYRLYDVTYMEALLMNLPLILPKELGAGLKAFDFKESIASIEVDLDKCEFNAVMEDGAKKNISTYGKGHQAMLNMMIGAGI